MGVMFSGNLRFLSNFHVEPFSFDAWELGAGEMACRTAASGEHAFNALKTADVDQQAWVLAAPTPLEAKRRGRRVALRPDWDTGGRVLAMQVVLRGKFRPGSRLAELLVQTGTLRLVETNYWHDQFWGDCYCPRHSGTPGVNMLGELLMSRRARIASN